MSSPRSASVRQRIMLSGVIFASVMGAIGTQPLNAQPPEAEVNNAGVLDDSLPSDGAETTTSSSAQVSHMARSITTRAIGTITGEGTAGRIAKFTGPNQIGNSVIVESAGNIGIGTAAPASKLTVTGAGAISIQGDNSSTAVGAIGIQGRITSGAPGANAIGVRGINSGTNTNGSGVYGSHAGGGIGVYGTSNTGRGVLGSSTNGYGVFGSSSRSFGVYGLSNSIVANVSGVQGILNTTTPGANSSGVRGENKGTNSNGYGVYGSHAGSGSGVYGTAPNGPGVFGNSSGGTGVFGNSSGGSGVFGNSIGGTGVFAQSSTGNAVEGRVTTSSGSGIAVYGNHLGSGYGVYGSSAGGVAIFGTSSATSGGAIGVWGVGAINGTRGDSVNGSGLYGESATGNAVLGNITATSTGIGVHGIATNGAGVRGSSSGGYGVHGSSTNTVGVYGSSTHGAGVYGNSTNAAGVYGFSSGNDGIVGQSGSNSHAGVAGTHAGDGNGVYGESANGYAGYFAGFVHITGTLSKGAGTFKIDHPLDPANKYLSHSFVESPDMMNIYNGNVTLDKKGQATVKMPDYFSALNREFRYQLTAVGAPGPNLYVAQEINSNQFKVAGGKPGMKVSWQVTGVRKDAYANANRVAVVQEKKGNERGAYLHPEAFGQPKEKAIGYAKRPGIVKPQAKRMAQQMAAQSAKK